MELPDSELAYDKAAAIMWFVQRTLWHTTISPWSVAATDFATCDTALANLRTLPFHKMRAVAPVEAMDRLEQEIHRLRDIYKVASFDAEAIGRMRCPRFDHTLDWLPTRPIPYDPPLICPECLVPCDRARMNVERELRMY
jgi:hypothetical protein